MPAPRDTREESSYLGALVAGFDSGRDGLNDFITGQEAQGQREMVNSTVIPRELLHSTTEEALTALGFVLGEPTDDLFREADLPPGWKREGSDHAMWSYIVDELGRERCSIFYKAAFYDRSAHLSLTSLTGYLSNCANAYGDGDPKPVIYDETWATPEAVAAEAADLAERAKREAEDRRGYYPDGVAQSLKEAERYEAIAEAARKIAPSSGE